MRNHNPNLVYWCTSGVAVVMGSCSAHWGQDSWNTGGEGGPVSTQDVLLVVRDTVLLTLIILWYRMFCWW